MSRKIKFIYKISNGLDYGDKKIELLKIKHDEGEIKEIKSDYVLGLD